MTLQSVQHGIESYRAWATDPRPRIGMGLPFFDQATNGGLAKAECAMFLAYSSVGKTSLGLNMIANNPSVPTVVFSLEMSWRMVMARLAAITTGVPTWELEKMLRSGTTPQQILDLIAAFPVLLGDDRSELSLKEMSASVKEAGSKIGQVRLVIIDYLELIGGAGMLGKSEQVDRAAQKIRSLAKDNDCSVVVLHQVAKTDGSGGHKPLSLDSGKFGGHHPMDYVVGAYAPRLDRELTGDAKERVREELYLQLLKNRSGRAMPDGVRHRQDPATGRITPWGGQVVIPQLTTPYQASISTYDQMEEEGW